MLTTHCFKGPHTLAAQAGCSRVLARPAACLAAPAALAISDVLPPRRAPLPVTPLMPLLTVSVPHIAPCAYSDAACTRTLGLWAVQRRCITADCRPFSAVQLYSYPYAYESAHCIDQLWDSNPSLSVGSWPEP